MYKQILFKKFVKKKFLSSKFPLNEDVRTSRASFKDDTRVFAARQSTLIRSKNGSWKNYLDFS
jgi:hypothetical protein